METRLSLSSKEKNEEQINCYIFYNRYTENSDSSLKKFVKTFKKAFQKKLTSESKINIVSIDPEPGFPQPRMFAVNYQSIAKAKYIFFIGTKKGNEILKNNPRHPLSTEYNLALKMQNKTLEILPILFEGNSEECLPVELQTTSIEPLICNDFEKFFSNVLDFIKIPQSERIPKQPKSEAELAKKQQENEEISQHIQQLLKKHLPESKQPELQKESIQTESKKENLTSAATPFSDNQAPSSINENVTQIPQKKISNVQTVSHYPSTIFRANKNPENCVRETAKKESGEEVNCFLFYDRESNDSNLLKFIKQLKNDLESIKQIKVTTSTDNANNIIFIGTKAGKYLIDQNEQSNFSKEYHQMIDKNFGKVKILPILHDGKEDECLPLLLQDIAPIAFTDINVDLKSVSNRFDKYEKLFPRLLETIGIRNIGIEQPQVQNQIQPAFM